MGGGGDGGYAERQAAEDAQKQQARSALNALFGVGTVSAPTREQFTRTVQMGNGEGGFENVSEFDQAAYDRAMADFNAGGTDIAKNKAGREALYQKARDDAFAQSSRQLNERRTDAARDLKFELFAKGLAGGSVDLDQNALLDRTYRQGLLEAGSRADSTRADLMGSDEQTRLGLLQSIDSGMDQGSALSSALNQMKVNSERASANAQGQSVGDLFGDAGLLYTRSRRAQGAQDWLAQNPGYGYRTPRSTGSTGVVTRTGG